MDWIERLTGLELDGGSGVLEWAILILPVAAAAFAWRRLRQARRRP